MNKNSNPLDYIIRCCEQGLIPELFDIKNAKDELKSLRKNSDTNRWIDCEKELVKLKESLNNQASALEMY